ncbi:MAG: hypothetical protein JW849_07385 [Phycisphaerae bacterium]|nr:hypothetical protein [Phycisphaerae bacterium]
MNETNTHTVAWALEFGGSAVRRIRLTRTADGFRADRYAEAPLPARWTAAPDLASAAGQLPAEDVSAPLAACLGNDLVLYRTIRLPQADDATLEKMVRSQLEMLLPTQAEKFTAAWKTLSDPRETDLQRVLLCATRRDALAAISGVCERWRKGGADVTPSLPALANAWTEWFDAAEPVLLMDVGARSTALATICDGRIWRCAVADAGGDAWTEHIAKSLGVSCQEAERRKLQAAERNDPAAAKALEEAILAWAGGLPEAYHDCLAEMPPKARPKRCVLFGRASRSAGVAARVSKALNIPADVAPAPATLRLEEGLSFDTIGTLVGAALGEMRDPASMIRLARAKEEKPAGLKQNRRHWAGAVAWLLASVATLYALDLHEASRREEMVHAVYRDTYHQGGLVRQSAVGAFLETGAPAPLDVLERITRAASESIIVTSMSYARSGQVTLQGTLANEKECQDFLQKLTELGQVELRRARPDNDKFRFEIDLVFRQFAGAGASTRPASQPSTTPPPATAPTTQPAVSPESQPASRPTGGGA